MPFSTIIIFGFQSKASCRFFLVGIAVLLLTNQPLKAEWQLGILGGINHGKQILETGSKTRNSNGFAGGSRLTYPRNFNYGGLLLQYNSSPFSIRSRMQTTGWYVDTGTARNEDFSLYEYSTIRNNGFDLKKLRYRDTPYTITGSRNFADAKGRSTMSEQDWEIQADWFAWSDSDTAATGFFFSAGLHYTYFKYNVYDVIQYIRLQKGFYLSPIGIGNSFSNSQLESPVGVGYMWQWEHFSLKASLLLNGGFNTGRDHHKQRNINFNIRNGWGNGIIYTVEGSYHFGPDKRYRLFTSLRGHRYFSRGHIEFSGGLGNEAFIQYLGLNQSVRLSTKEIAWESGFTSQL